MKKIAVFFLIFLISLTWTNPTLAWGQLTHIVVNSEAFNKVYNVSTGENYEIFITAGQMPDMLVQFRNTKGYGKIKDFPERFSYAHDLAKISNSIPDFLDGIDGDLNGSTPYFGKVLVNTFENTKYKERFSEKDKYFAYGYSGHLFGDRQAHGKDGYIARRNIEKFGKNDSAKHVLHEISLDLYFYTLYRDKINFDETLVSIISPKLIHEASINAYNQLKNSTGEKFIDRKRGILINKRLEIIAEDWAKYMAVYKNFIRVVSIYEKFKKTTLPDYFYTYFNNSVSDLADFVQNPNTGIPGLEAKNYFWEKLAEFFKLKEAKAQKGSTDFRFLFFNDLTTQLESLGGIRVIESWDGGMVEYKAEVTDESLFNQALTETIDNFKQNSDPDYAVTGRFMDNLVNRDDLSFEQSLEEAVNPGTYPKENNDLNDDTGKSSESNPDTDLDTEDEGEPGKVKSAKTKHTTESKKEETENKITQNIKDEEAQEFREIFGEEQETTEEPGEVLGEETEESQEAKEESNLPPSQNLKSNLGYIITFALVTLILIIGVPIVVKIKRQNQK